MIGGHNGQTLPLNLYDVIIMLEILLKSGNIHQAFLCNFHEISS